MGGEVIMAHSCVLGIRSEYFKTALKTSIRIPEDIGSEDAKSLLAMADLYLMEDLKDAVGPLISTTIDNILEISEMAEKYSSQKLKEMCCEFIFQNIDTLDKQMLIELNKALPLVGEKALLNTKNSRKNKVSSLKKRVN